MEQAATDKRTVLPDTAQIKEELDHARYRQRYSNTMRSTIYILITVAAAAVLVATLLMPVLQIYGTSMSPTLTEGNIVISLKSPEIRRGDVIGFYYNNKLLVKRVVGMSGDTIDIDENGNVTLNGESYEENYVSTKALGECDIELPYTVPDDRYFVMGDNRANSLDSRSSAIGSVSKDQIVGKLVFRVWPMDCFGRIGADAAEESP